MGFIFRISKYFILLALSLTPVIWFTGIDGALVNGVDTNFPLDPLIWFQRRFFVWNNVTNGGIDFSSSTAGLFFHLIQVIPFQLGFNLQMVQIINLVFWFSLIILSSFMFAKTISPKSFLVQILFVILYAFNPYLFNTWENVKVANLSLIAAIPAVLATIVSLNYRWINIKTSIFISAIIGIILSGSGINPAYFFVFFLVLAIFYISNLISQSNLKSAIFLTRNFLLVSLIIILVNLFWILPTANFIFKNIPVSGSIDRLGFTNWVDSLSDNTSLLNVMRVQGAWDWYAFDSITGLPVYIPYVLNYFYKIPFILFSFLIPTLAILALIFRGENKRELYLAFGLMFLIGIFLGAGTHLPTGVIFRYLSERLPFFTIFRSPWYIFTPLVILSLAVLVSLFFDHLNISLQHLKFGVNKTILFFLATLLIIGNLLYSYPLVMGKIFRPGRQDSFYVKFPDYLFESKQWLLQNQGTRIVGYPDDDLEKFRWGYIGIESILGLFTNQEMLFPSFNAPDSPVAILLKEFYKDLKRGRVDATLSLASKLNIGWFFHKKDQKSISPGFPDEFVSLPKKTFGQWDFYQMPVDKTLPKFSIVGDTLFVYPYNKSAGALGLIDYDQIILNQDDKIISNLNNINQSSGNIILADNLQKKSFQDFKFAPSNLADRLLTRDLSKVDFVFRIPTEGIYQPIIESYKLEDFGIDLTKSIEFEMDGKKVMWEISNISNSFVYFKPIFFSIGDYKISLNLQNKNLIMGGGFEEGINFEKGGYGEGKGIYEIKEEKSEKFLSILNIKKADVSADFTVSSFNKFVPYYVEVRYKQIYGNNALVLAGQNNKNTLIKTQVERLPNYPEWNWFSFYYEPVETDSTMKVILSAPFTKDPLGTKIFYDELKVYKVFSNEMFLIKKNNSQPKVLSKITFKKINPTMYEGQVTSGKNSHIIVFSENYSPDWEISLYQEDGLKIPITPPHFSANLYANAWYIDGVPEKYLVKIYYNPQQLFWLGGVVGLTVVVISAIIYISSVIRQKRLE